MKNLINQIKTNKTVQILLVIILAYIIYRIVKKKKSKDLHLSEDDVRKSDKGKLFNVDIAKYNDCYDKCKTQRIAYTNDEFPIQIGSKGERVKKLQKAIKDMGVNIEVDGMFGCQTDCLTKSIFNKSIFTEEDYNKFVK